MKARLKINYQRFKLISTALICALWHNCGYLKVAGTLAYFTQKCNGTISINCQNCEKSNPTKFKKFKIKSLKPGQFQVCENFKLNRIWKMNWNHVISGFIKTLMSCNVLFISVIYSFSNTGERTITNFIFLQLQVIIHIVQWLAFCGTLECNFHHVQVLARFQLGIRLSRDWNSRENTDRDRYAKKQPYTAQFFTCPKNNNIAGRLLWSSATRRVLTADNIGIISHVLFSCNFLLATIHDCE